MASVLAERKQREAIERRRKLAAGEVVITHGQLSSYNNYGCRCGPCTAAYMEWYSIYSASKKRPTHKSLPADLREICDTVSPEIAALVQEQYDDDQAVRYGYALRVLDLT